jgi:hypothetical protein
LPNKIFGWNIKSNNAIFDEFILFLENDIYGKNFELYLKKSGMIFIYVFFLIPGYEMF